MQQSHQPKLFGGLRPNDLENMVSPRFTVDQYKSKMGNDEDIIVLAFKVKDKFPATDLMEFIEKGFPFVLDADMSSGEESDGQYRVFVELLRTKKAAEEIDTLLRGIGKLCDCEKWRFKYFKDIDAHEATVEAINNFIPLLAGEYKDRVKTQKIDDAKEVLDQGPAEVVDIDENNNLTFSKLYSGDLTVKLESIGEYSQLESELQGGIQLDESSRGQVLFLEKYLGNYEIHKINDKFLIRNKDQAMIISKDTW
jgi:hypothetical protein